MRTTIAIKALILAGVALAQTGCETMEDYSLTYRVWDNSRWQQWSQPASNPNLALFAPSNHADLLVRYDALSERDSIVKPQAYFLWSNQARIAAREKPRLVNPPAASGLLPIPLLPALPTATNHPIDETAFAVTTNEGREFMLYQSGKDWGSFQLPEYPESSRIPARILLTPFALAGDTVMVGVVGASVACYWWLASGAPGVNHH